MNKFLELFEPVKIGKLRIKNKTSMAPMGPVGYADSFGGFNQRIQDYYVERAKNDVGLIITGICSVDMQGEGIPSIGLPCPTSNPLAFIHSTYQMNERIHAYDAKIFLQLTGGLGRSALPGFVSKTIAPSEQENRFDPKIVHREMTREEIMTLIKKFVMSAVIAKKSGFDGVEVHAVHEGYLLDQFAISLFNHRTDEFGGSLENRLRITTEIVKGIKKACGPDFPVSLRYSLKSCMKDLRQGGLPGEDYKEVGKDIDEGIEAAKILVDAGYDALNVDAGTYDSWYWNHPPMYFEDGMYREFGEILKKHVNVPIILAGRMDDPNMAIESLGKSCDIVSYGRPLLADPEFVSKIKYNKLDEIRPCLGCHEGCLGRISNAPVSCAVNPACGRESIYGLTPALQKKRVLVIGGGIAGMEVARISSLRGHTVILCEKTDKLGGNLIPGGVPHFKRYDRKLVEYYKHQLELLNVEIKYNTMITKENIDSYNANIIVTATGSTPKSISLEGTQKTITADQVLLGKANVGENVVIVGGGLVGCETGLWLAQQGKNVSIVEVLPEILGGHGTLPHMNEYMLIDLLKFHNVKIYKDACIVKTKDTSVEVKQNDKNFELLSDTVITSIGYKENDSLFMQLKDTEVPVFNIGDSSQVHNIMYSIWNAYELAKNI
ncbi:2-enoate reductase [Sedimentibacter acidaminivorans]|uniref:2-enoate reductase n=1 Tax=Sedimentibacter acidaminivorans TaxID=913099 RepID=A0ABS4GI47_9FIRM|nr:FAD-dependent oxidoreductase [Sedimentibacter acidaminivorans]MBP1927365.1 2-enoate reductase [Sedimentibacter acidaminivorans]